MMKKINKKKLIIFDCDGVLFDSAEANIEYFKKCLKILKLPDVPASFLQKVPYLSILQLFTELLNDEKMAKEAFIESQKIPYDTFLIQMKPLFNFDYVLSQLKKKYYLAIASNRSRSLQKVWSFFNLNRYFHHMVSVLDAKAKPDPGMLYNCITYFNVKKDQSVFIGDSVTDRQSAKNAGIDYISVGNIDDNENQNDIFSISNCNELINIF